MIDLLLENQRESDNEH